MLDYLERNIKSNPVALADVFKEHPEELDERHERVVAGSLKAWDRLLDALLPAEPSENPGRATSCAWHAWHDMTSLYMTGHLLVL